MHDCVNQPGARPSDGDVAVCWRCRAVSVFAVSPLGVVALRAPTADEERDVMADPRITASLDAVADSRSPAQAAALAHAYLQERP